MSILGIPEPTAYESSFHTTHKRTLVYWITSFAIAPPYLLSIQYVLTYFRGWLGGLFPASWIVDALMLFLSLCAVLPLGFSLLQKSTWHLATKGRWWLAICGIVGMIVILVFEHLSQNIALPIRTVQMYSLTLLLWGTVNLYFNPSDGSSPKPSIWFGRGLMTVFTLLLPVIVNANWDSVYLLIPLINVVLMVAALCCLSLATISELFPYQPLEQVCVIFILVIISLFLLFITNFNIVLSCSAYLVIIAALYIFARNYPYVKSVHDLLPPFITSFILGLLFIVSEMLPPSIKTSHPAVIFVSSIGLLLFLIASLPNQFLSRQATFQRELLKRYRQTNLRSRFSEDTQLPNSLNRIILRIVNTISLDNPALIVITSIALGIVEASARNAQIPSLLNALSVGTATFVLGSILYFFVWSVRHRRYIILPFQTSDQRDETLLSIAALIPHNLVDQVQEIGMLLNQRQVETAGRGTSEAMALFVTSGLAPEQLTDFQSLVSIDTPGGNAIKSALGTILSIFARLFATEVISGVVRRGKGGRPEIWIEITQRHKKTSLGKFEVPETLAGDFDEKTLRKLIRGVAVELTLRLGKRGKVASSTVSLNYLLEGLQASKERNWWRAIEAYRSAIRVEESAHGAFGFGYYHLGAALVFQGELDEAKKYLQQAEASSVPGAETQYMLALVSLHDAWDSLDILNIEFHDIVRRCKIALSQRPYFPEAYNLLGAAYYQRAKLLHRQNSKCYVSQDEERTKETDSDPKTSQHYITHYKQAVNYFKRSIQQYERGVLRLSNNAELKSTIRDEIRRISREQITAIHRLADAMRSLGRYIEAYSYYSDVLAVFPGNVTTYTDLLKTYCLAGSWQHADELLRREILILPEAFLDVHIQLHAGWIYAGGIASETSAMWPNGSAESQPTTLHPSEAENPKPDQADVRQARVRQLGFAMSYIDFAIHQRPQYIARWEQTDWQSPFLKACTSFINRPHELDDLRKIYDAPIVAVRELGQDIQKIKNHVIHLKLWLAWRMDSRGYHDPNDPLMKIIRSEQTGSARTISDKNSLDKDKYPYPTMREVYKELKAQRQNYVNFLNEVRDSGRLYGMRHRLHKLEWAARSLNFWKEANTVVTNNLIAPNVEITFGARWAIDVYAEQSLFTARLLVEAGAYETAWSVAKQSSKSIVEWLKIWDQKFNLKNRTVDRKRMDFKFTPRVLRYQLATLKSLQAYAAIYMNQDFVTKVRINAKEQAGSARGVAKPMTRASSVKRRLFKKIRTVLLFCAPVSKAPLVEEISSMKDAQEAYRSASTDILEAFQLMPRHSLAMFVQAYLLRREGRTVEAIDVLHRLLTVLSPYDPNLHIANWQPAKKQKPQSDAIKEISGGAEEKKLRREYKKRYKNTSLRNRLTYQNLVCGSQQLDKLIDVATVHRVLSNTLAEHGELDLSVRHIAEAASWSLYWDVESDCLLLLARRLERLDRFQDAQAAISALHRYRQILETNTLSITKVKEPDILGCIIHSRLGRFHEALKKDMAIEEHYVESRERKGIERYSRRLLHFALSEQLENLYARITKSGNSEVKQFAKALGTLCNITNFRLNQVQLDHLTLLAAHYFDPAKLARILALIEGDQSVALQDYDRVASILYKTRHAEKYKFQSPVLAISRNITAALLEFLVLEAVMTAEQYSELNNNIVYSYIESGRSSERSGAEGLENRIQNALDVMKKLEQAAHSDVTAYGQRYRQYIAQYYDTNAWYLFRSLDPSTSYDKIHNQLHSARELLANEALSYDGSSAILYYHITRIELTMLERLWQSIDTTNIAMETASKSSIIDEHLSHAVLYWSRAVELDRNGRLEDKLEWIGKRLIEYRKAWKDRHLRTFGGEEKA